MVATRSSSEISISILELPPGATQPAYPLSLVAVFHAVELGIGYCNKSILAVRAILVGGIYASKDSAKTASLLAVSLTDGASPGFYSPQNCLAVVDIPLLSRQS